MKTLFATFLVLQAIGVITGSGVLRGVTPEQILEQQIQKVKVLGSNFLEYAEAKVREMNATIQQLRSNTTRARPSPRIDYMVKYNSCSDIYTNATHKGGLYFIWLPTNFTYLPVNCFMENQPTRPSEAGWIIIQRRYGESLNFHRSYVDYEQGFGNPMTDFWIGLKNLHMLTNDYNMNKAGRYRKLKIGLEGLNGQGVVVTYSAFQISGNDSHYAISVLSEPLISAHHIRVSGLLSKNQGFVSSLDTSNDCNWSGGWWFRSCGDSNIHGILPKPGASPGQQMHVKGFGLLRRVSILLQ